MHLINTLDFLGFNKVNPVIIKLIIFVQLLCHILSANLEVIINNNQVT